VSIKNIVVDAEGGSEKLEQAGRAVTDAATDLAKATVKVDFAKKRIEEIREGQGRPDATIENLEPTDTDTRKG
jgi:hypothetical protein